MFTTSSAPPPSTASSSSTTSPSPPQTHPPTEILVGRYKLIRPLSRGAFGLVGEYEDLIRHERVAIKAIRPNVVATEGKRLMREVDLLHFLHARHPCVISYDCVFVAPGEREGGGSAGVARQSLRLGHWGDGPEEEGGKVASGNEKMGRRHGQWSTSTTYSHRSTARESGGSSEGGGSGGVGEREGAAIASRAVSSSLWVDPPAPPPAPAPPASSLWRRPDAAVSTTGTYKGETPSPPRPSLHLQATASHPSSGPEGRLAHHHGGGGGGEDGPPHAWWASGGASTAAAAVPFSTNVYTQRNEAGGEDWSRWGPSGRNDRFLAPPAEAGGWPPAPIDQEDGEGRGEWVSTASPPPLMPLFSSTTLLSSPPYADPIYALYTIFQSLNTFHPSVYPSHLSANEKHLLHLKGMHALASWVLEAQDGWAGGGGGVAYPSCRTPHPPMEEGLAASSHSSSPHSTPGGSHTKKYPSYRYNSQSHSNTFSFGLPQLPPPPLSSQGSGNGEDGGGASLTESERSYFVYIVMPYCHGDLMGFIKLIQELPDSISEESSSERVGVGEEPPAAAPSHAAALVSSFPPNYFAVSAVVLCFQMVLGLDVLHQCQIVHRDIKPENILVNLQQEDPFRSTALLADFGLARDEEMSETMYVCTRYYRPPELIARYETPGPASDIWSIGCILFEVCTGMVLFQVSSSVNDKGVWDGGMASDQLEMVLNMVGTPTPEEIETHCPAGNPKAYLLACSRRYSQVSQFFYDHFKLYDCAPLEKDLWLDLIKRCLAFFPRQRPTAEEVCRHRLFLHYGLHYWPPSAVLSSSSSTSISPTFFFDAWNGEANKEGKRVGHPIADVTPSPPPSASYVPFANDPILRRRLSHTTGVALKKDLLSTILHGLSALEMEGEAVVEKENAARMEDGEKAIGEGEEEEEEAYGGGERSEKRGDEKRKRERNEERRGWRAPVEEAEAHPRRLAVLQTDEEDEKDDDDEESVGSLDEVEFRKSMQQAAIAAAAVPSTSPPPLPWASAVAGEASASSSSSFLRPYRYYYADASDPPSSKARLSRGVDKGRATEGGAECPLAPSSSAPPLPLYRLSFPAPLPPSATSSSSSFFSAASPGDPIAMEEPIRGGGGGGGVAPLLPPRPTTPLSPVLLSVTSTSSCFSQETTRQPSRLSGPLSHLPDHTAAAYQERDSGGERGPLADFLGLHVVPPHRHQDEEDAEEVVFVEEDEEADDDEGREGGTAFTSAMLPLQDEHERPPTLACGVQEQVASVSYVDHPMYIQTAFSDHSPLPPPCPQEDSPLQSTSSQFLWSDDNVTPLSTTLHAEHYGRSPSSSSSLTVNDAWETESEAEERRHRKTLANLGVPPSVLHALKRRNFAEF